MTKMADPFDELAAMFLTGKDTPESPATASGSQTELLVVGHLPVRAGLWLAPYAEARARTCGPTAMIRLDGPEPELQLIGACRDAPFQTDHLTLSEAIAQIGSSIAMWIVRPPVSPPDSSELMSQMETGRITLLTGADEVAVVECYRSIKCIVEEAQRKEIELLDLGVAMIGVDEEAAGEAFTRIQHTTAEQLGINLELVLTLPRIGSDDAREVFGRDPIRWLSFPDQPMPTLKETMFCIAQCTAKAARNENQPPEVQSPAIETLSTPGIPNPVGAPPPMRLVQPPPAPEYQTPPTEIPTQQEVEPFPQIPTTPQGVESTEDRLEEVRSLQEEIAGSTSHDSGDDSGGRTIMVETKEPATIREPDVNGQPVSLAEYVEGLIPLPIRPPNQERVELAVDSEGAMHLLCREEELRSLDVVARWARDHHEILRLACPLLKTPADSPRVVARHVFTNAPVALADLHGGDLHLHVLTKVIVEGMIGWYAAPLNRP